MIGDIIVSYKMKQKTDIQFNNNYYKYVGIQLKNQQIVYNYFEGIQFIVIDEKYLETVDVLTEDLISKILFIFKYFEDAIFEHTKYPGSSIIFSIETINFLKNYIKSFMRKLKINNIFKTNGSS